MPESTTRCSKRSRLGVSRPTAGRLASLLGAIKIAHRGGQNHRPSHDEIAAQYKENFGTSIF